jgi:hypothetical protein
MHVGLCQAPQVTRLLDQPRQQLSAQPQPLQLWQNRHVMHSRHQGGITHCTCEAHQHAALLPHKGRQCRPGLLLLLLLKLLLLDRRRRQQAAAAQVLMRRKVLLTGVCCHTHQAALQCPLQSSRVYRRCWWCAAAGR